MINTKRQHEIIKLLESTKTSMRVSDLAHFFNVTQTTIRRDLAYLEQNKHIMRTHGAVQITPQNLVPNYNKRFEINIDEKKKIAKMALSQIHSNDSIIIDSGTTMIPFAEELLNQDNLNLTVITNSIPVATLLSTEEQFKVTLAGGIVQSQNLSAIGPDTELFFEKIVVNCAFIGSTGVHPTAGLTASSSFHVSLKKRMIRCADRVIALLDSSKFLTSDVNVFCDFNKISAIITIKTEENSAIIDQLIAQGVNIILAN